MSLEGLGKIAILDKDPEHPGVERWKPLDGNGYPGMYPESYTYRAPLLDPVWPSEETDLDVIIPREAYVADKGWNPPHGDMPLNLLGAPDLMDKKYAEGPSTYKFPWYMRFLNLWYGLKCLCTTGRWPVRVLYFSKEYKLDGELFPKIHAEIEKNPRAFSKF